MIEELPAQGSGQPDPSSMTADEMYLSAMERVDGYGEMFRFHRDVRNMPFRVNPGRVREGLEKTIWSCLGKSPKVMNHKAEKELWEEARQPGHAADLLRAEMKNLKIAAAGHVGTHTCKVPNPNVTAPRAVFADQDVMMEAARLPFLSSAALKPGLKFGAAGNAGQNRGQRLLCAVFDVGGKIVSLLEDVAERGEFYDALVTMLGESRDIDEIADILAARLEAGIDEEPGGYAKTLIWPTEEGDVVITPIHPYAMHDAFQKRYRERVAEGSMIPYVSMKVGGTEPQNPGLVNLDHGGWHRQALAVPPGVGSKADRMFYRACFAGELAFASVGKSHPAWKDFLRVVASKDWDNDAARKALNRSLRKLIDIAIRPYLALKKALKDDDPLAKSALSSLPSIEKAILKGRMDRLEKGEIGGFVDRVVLHVSRMAERHGILFDDAMRRLARLAVEDRLAKFF